MKTIQIIIMAYAVIISLIGYLSMAVDKSRARNHAYRIPEKTLFAIAILGGGIGSTLGMKTFRHKTKHWYFLYGMPIIAVLNLVVYAYLIKLTLGA